MTDKPEYKPGDLVRGIHSGMAFEVLDTSDYQGEIQVGCYLCKPTDPFDHGQPRAIRGDYLEPA